MAKLTMIARVRDELPLAEGLDDSHDQKDAEFYKQQSKYLFKEASRMSIETGPYYLHYIIEGCVCYLTMGDRSYPKELALQYLDELKNEFERVNGNQIETAARPYAFIEFDTFIKNTKKQYLDTQKQRNLAKLNDALNEVHHNIQEVLGVGEKLDQVSEMSSCLTSESGSFADKAKDLNRQTRQMADKFQFRSPEESRKILLEDLNESFDKLEECVQYCVDHAEDASNVAEVEAHATETESAAKGIIRKTEKSEMWEGMKYKVASLAIAAAMLYMNSGPKVMLSVVIPAAIYFCYGEEMVLLVLLAGGIYMTAGDNSLLFLALVSGFLYKLWEIASLRKRRTRFQNRRKIRSHRYRGST